MHSPTNAWEQELLSLHTRLAPLFHHRHTRSLPISGDYSVTLSVKMAGNWRNG